MKAGAEKSSTTSRTPAQPFVSRTGAAGFFEPGAPPGKSAVAEAGIGDVANVGASPPPEVTSLKSALFSPSPIVARHIDAGKRSGASIKVGFGAIARGEINVRKRKDVYETIGVGRLPLAIPVLRPLQEAGIPLILAVRIDENRIEGYLSVANKSAPSRKSFLRAFCDGTSLFGWTGLKFKPFADNTVNEISGGVLRFGQRAIPVRLGGFLDSRFSLELADERLSFDGNGVAEIPGLQPTAFSVALGSDGRIRGEVGSGVAFRNFSGSVRLRFLDGLVDGRGEARYSTEKLSGVFHIVVTDRKTARTVAFDAIPAEQLNQSALDQSGLHASGQTAEPKPGPRAIAGTATLNFAFNEWLSGTALVVVDGVGHVTVVSEITPQKEVTLFRSRAYPESGPKTLFSVNPKFRYGVPYVADIHVGISVALTTSAVLGPALLRNIAVKGTYSTDPLIFNRFALSADLYVQAQAELVLALKASAGITILFHDIDVGAGIEGALVLKAYVEGSPTIGYREKADPEQGKKGEFFIKGTAVAVAQPFFTLKGYLFVDLDSPRLSPAPDKRWTWPMLDKEYPLGSGWGIGMTVGGSEGYVLGSGKPPEIDFKPAQFDASRFIDQVVDDNVPERQARSADAKNRFSDQLKGQAPSDEPQQPDIGIAGDGKQKQKAPTDAKLTEKWMNAINDGLIPLRERADKKPFDQARLTRELSRLRSRFGFTGISARKAGDDWLVIAEMFDRSNKHNPVALKGVPGDDGKAEPPVNDETLRGNTLPERIDAGLRALEQVTEGYSRQGATEEELAAAIKAVRRKFAFKAIRQIKKSGYWFYGYEINPKGELKGPQVRAETLDAAARVPLTPGSWIRNLKTGSYERVSAAMNVVVRSPSGESKAVRFGTDKPEGGAGSHAYADEGIGWERSRFTHPSGYVMPDTSGAKFVLKPRFRGGDFIRPNFYKDTRTSRENIVRNKLPRLLDPSDRNFFLSEGSVAREAAQGYTRTYNGKAVVPVVDASPDHDPPIAEHWTKKRGNDSDQAARENWNIDPATYNVMSLKLNLSLGSRGEKYTDFVGVHFRGPGE